jgi:hypothetical protein
LYITGPSVTMETAGGVAARVRCKLSPAGRNRNACTADGAIAVVHDGTAAGKERIHVMTLARPRAGL